MEAKEIVTNFRQECFDRQLYLSLAKRERDEDLRAALMRIAEMEGGHAEVWRKLAEAESVKLPSKPLRILDKARLRFYLLMRRLMGSKLFYRYLDYKETGDSEKYLKFAEAPDLSEGLREDMRRLAIEEAVHERVFSTLELGYSAEFVYGISDGLVEVLAAVSGLSGAISSALLVALGGLIIGVSGSLSMGIGAFLSTKVEEEGKRSEKRIVELEKRLDPRAVEKRLEEFLRSAGLEGRIDPESLVHVAENVLFKDEGADARKAALVTMASYFTGAVIPTLPFALGLSGLSGVLASYAVSLASVAIVGYFIGVISMANARMKSLQMTALALGAALATHFIGLLANALLGLRV